MSKLELLAPAGNEKSFLSALNSGADAIYLGLADFNARGNIENFNDENLKKCVEKAHLFGVKVYLTLNTLVLDNEFENVLSVIKQALEAKVDAFIVQDIGLASFLKETFEDIELHASTQMGVSNLEGAKYLKDIGFSRIVLARETPLYEIKRIKDNLDIELEYFVHGALCVSYSGNCYLCSLSVGASGNRGKCKQFCRLPAVIKNGDLYKEGYLLSTKDICMLPCLKELADAGITSFKIEGRARREGYVAGVVKIYRDAIDNDFSYSEENINALKKLFNRGNFAQGYLKNEEMIYNQTQNHLGVKIGEILSIKKGKRFNEVYVKSTHELKSGDAVKCFVNGKEVESVGLQDVKRIDKNKYCFTTTVDLPEKAELHLIVDRQLEEQMLALKRKLEVKGEFVGRIGERAKLKLSCGEIETYEESEEILECAKSQPLSKEDCKNQIGKLGEDFVLTELNIEIDNIFMAKSQLNKLRRNAVDKLTQKLIQQNEKQKIVEKAIQLNFNENKNIKIKQKNNENNINKKIIYFNSLKIMEKYLNNTDYFVYNPEFYNENEINDYCKKHENIVIYLSLPIMTVSEDVKKFKGLLIQNENLGVVANNYYALELTTPQKTIIGSNMNVANSFAVNFYSKQGYDKIILSKENFDLSTINSFDAQLFQETDIRKTLMHFRHCPFKDNLQSKCECCKYKKETSYKIANRNYLLRRKRTSFCQFELIEDKPTLQSTSFGKVVEIDN